MNYEAFFSRLTGKSPFPWQLRLQQRMALGDSVIIRVPTGAGKTWGAVAPFLFSRQEGSPIADRLLYSLPLRSLASSLHTTVSSEMAKVFPKVSVSGKDRLYDGSTQYCSLQVGGKKGDPFLEGDIVFTTIDQLLSSYILLPVSLPPKLDNINAGAIIGSLVVIDELHLLDAQIALGTLIEMLCRLKGLCRFVLMTATLSDASVEWLEKKLGAAKFVVHDEEIAALPSQQNKQRSWRLSAEPLTAELVCTGHVGGRTIALLNSVARAQKLFENIQEFYAQHDAPPRLLLLHSRYYPEDREQAEKELDDYFGPQASKTNVILVTTQVIEAGIDISADVLHTELAPMNALIQRAGRTARYRDRSIGSVTVYGPPGLNPYANQREALEQTRTQLPATSLAGEVIGFTREREWIETVHGKAELAALSMYQNLGERSKQVTAAMDDGSRGRLSTLVRDVDSVNVLISDFPENLDFSGRNWPRLLSVSSKALLSLRERYVNLPEGAWVVKGATSSDDEAGPIRFNWRPVPSNALVAQWLIAIHPDFAGYDSQFGLRLDKGGPQPEIRRTETARVPRYQYDFETWEQHATRISQAATAMHPASRQGVKSLAGRYKVSEGQIDELVDLTCRLHDAGKLSVEWQSKAWAWQRNKDARMRTAGHEVPERPDVPIAHTWYDPQADWQLQRRPEYRFPHHAAEGAFAVLQGLWDGFADKEDWGFTAISCASSAIARHHNARTTNCELFDIDGQSQLAVNSILSQPMSLRPCKSETERSEFAEQGTLSFSISTDQEAYPLYAFLIRQLRLADQASLRGAQ